MRLEELMQAPAPASTPSSSGEDDGPAPDDAVPPGGTPTPPPPSPKLLARRKAGGVTLPGSALPPPSDDEGLTLALIDGVARQVVAAWCSTATPDALLTLKAAAPVIPSELDRALLVDLSGRVDAADLDDDTRHQVRDRFWYHIGRVRPV